MNMQPLVSIIALCHNHAPYLSECLQSVWGQTYPNIELIVVDDASTDGSVACIKALLQDKPTIPFISLEKNVGNCKAFNQGLALATGKYVVDLATDDVLLPQRIEKQVALLESLDRSYGVAFSDALLMDAQGRPLGNFYTPSVPIPPQGDVYVHLLHHAFICTPTMLIKREVLQELGGYDESLSYEDFDFWVRSGRRWKYAFQHEALTQKRVLPASLGQGFYKKKNNPHLQSSLIVCQKAQRLNKTPTEDRALAHAVRYHLRQSLFAECYALALDYGRLLPSLDRLRWHDHLWLTLAKWHIPLYYAYQVYRKS